MRGRVLVIAGSDSGGGAGIQADTKAITALGAFAATAISALTAQNTVGVHGVLPVPPDFLRLQIECVLDDLGADAVKTGMLDRPEIIEVVASCLAARDPLPLVLDPVMIAKNGAVLLAESALDTLKRALLPLASLVTPNLPEAEILAARPIETVDDMRRAADTLLRFGVPAVLMKGGHLRGDELVDLLVTRDAEHRFASRRQPTRHTHGTGCTLASAIAAGLSQNMALPDAVRRARDYVQAAIAAAPGFGRGAGPLDHSVPDPEPGAR
ncbi:bifunctional hydroxymethylpyrimidine kinase/phosphomethylpyrimidine kinase [Rhizosaccharibacter radicis]|uniref:hydroxymethylpyrimidine kinase n=1 Tax=Rhizosaccharibacter radicis TaxID=2782605 RepID=A0ABT1VVP0_9PROT|nr:bifunctional hydroxymethylpyrimidine kinase/phosphomethylpyrimidine kinase [Acetobacteraceae bacterium KSS12]